MDNVITDMGKTGSGFYKKPKALGLELFLHMLSGNMRLPAKGRKYIFYMYLMLFGSCTREMVPLLLEAAGRAVSNSGLSECFDIPEKFDFDWLMEMVRQLPAGESVAAKYEGYETSAMADGRILSATEHGAEIFVPDMDFFNKVQSQLEAADNADIDIGGIEYDGTTGGMIARYAMSKVGCSYVWGSSGPNTFECSGLVNWCAKMCGLTVPWAKVPGVSATNTRRSAANAQGYINAGKAIPTGEMKQGDFIFFASEGTANTVKNVTHVGIYVGDGKFVDARNRKKGVLLSEYSAYWEKRTTVVARPYD